LTLGFGFTVIWNDGELQAFGPHATEVANTVTISVALALPGAVNTSAIPLALIGVAI
jgi:hypothetical protein